MIDFSGIKNVFSPVPPSGTRFDFRTGDIVSTTVLEKVSPSTWKVDIAGKVHIAVSELPLNPGDVLSVRVQWQGEKLLLQIPGKSNDLVTSFLKQLGLPSAPSTQALVESFIRHGLPLNPDEITAAKKILERAKGSLIRNARFLAVLSGKGIKMLPPPGTDIVSDFFGMGSHESDDTAGQFDGYGSQGGNEDKRKDNERKDRLSESVQDAVCAKADDPETLLHLFNHIREGSRHWVAVPFSFTGDGETWKGLIRILLDDSLRKPVSMSVTITDDESEWSFLIHDREGRKHVSLYTLDGIERSKAEKRIPDLEKKLEKLNSIVSRTISDSLDFDGFSSENGTKTINGIDLSL